MFSPSAKIGSSAARERLVRARAAEEAGVLFARDGIAAVRTIQSELRTLPSAEERRYHRLVMLEIERLDRVRRNSAGGTAVALWKPRAFNLAGLARLLGFAGRRPRR